MPGVLCCATVYMDTRICHITVTICYMHCTTTGSILIPWPELRGSRAAVSLNSGQGMKLGPVVFRSHLSKLQSADISSAGNGVDSILTKTIFCGFVEIICFLNRKIISTKVVIFRFCIELSLTLMFLVEKRVWNSCF